MLLNILSGVVFFITSLILSVVVILICFNFFKLLTRNINLYKAMRENNVAIALLFSAFVISIFMIFCCAIEPIFQFILTDKLDISVLEKIIRASLMLSTSFLIAFLVNWFIMKTFSLLSNNMNEMQELRDNNIPLSVVLVSMILTITASVAGAVNNINMAYVHIPNIAEYGTEQPFISMDLFLFGGFELLITLFSCIMLFIVGFKAITFIIKTINNISDIKSDKLSTAILFCSVTISLFVVVNYNTIIHFDLAPILDNSFTLDAKMFIKTAISTLYYPVGSVVLYLVIVVGTLKIGLSILQKKVPEYTLQEKSLAITLLIIVFVISISIIARL